jgi:transcriptional regulator with XRE-family HTH domain
MEEEIKTRIKRCGIKQKYLCNKLGITPNYLSMCLNGKRTLSGEKLQKLKELI